MHTSREHAQPRPTDTADRRPAARPGDAASLGLAALFYLALTLVHTWPLARHLSDRLASDAGDPALNAWILWWNATTTPLTTAWWDGLGFWPTTGTLAFSEHLLGFAWLTSPIVWLGGSPPLAYNVAFLASYVLAAWGTHLLVWRLTGRHDAGLLAGLAVGFATIRAGHLSHLQVLMTGWMPVALLGLHEFWRTRRPQWLALFAVSWLLQALSNNYYALFFSVLVTLWLAWFGFRRGAFGRLAAAAAASMAASLAMLPLVRGYTAAHATHGWQRGLDETALFSADLAAFANAPRTLWLWAWIQTQNWGERELFGGLTALAIVLTLVWRRRSLPQTAAPSPAITPHPRWQALLGRVFVAAGVLALVGGIALAIDGRESLALAGLTISTRHPDKPIMVGMLLLGAAAALSASARRALHDRGVLTFYLLGWAACLVLSLGPEVRLFDTKLLYRTPYGLLYQFVPGFDGVRAPARFAMLASLCLGVAGGIAFARLTKPGTRGARAALAAAGVAILAEGALREMPLGAVPAPPPAIAYAGDVVLELPIGDVFGEAGALYRTSVHRQRLANGYSGHEPLFYRALRDGLELGDAPALRELTSLSAVTVVLDRRRDGDGKALGLAQAAGATIISESPDVITLRAPRHPPTPPPAPIVGERLAIVGAESSKESARVHFAVDGDPTTSWSTSDAQDNGDTILVDLGRVAVVSGVEIDQGKWPADVPRRAEVSVSDDRQHWRFVWDGITAVQTMRAVLADPLKVRLSMPFAATPARYVRVRQTADGGRTSWTLAELRVFGTPVTAR